MGALKVWNGTSWEYTGRDGTDGVGYAVVARDEKAQNTGGGAFNSGAWNTRTLNTLYDPSSIASLSSNQVTLPAGTYLARGGGVGRNVDRHQTRLQNVTDASTVLAGCPMYAAAAVGEENESHFSGTFTIASSKAFELQHQCQTSNGGAQGYGVEGNFTTEVYGWLEFLKIS